MNGHKLLNARRFSIAGSLCIFFAYILSFQFEGQVLYSLLICGMDANHYVLAAIIAHFSGLFTCGLFVKFLRAAKNMVLGGMGLCLAATIPSFFLSPPMVGCTNCQRIF